MQGVFSCLYSPYEEALRARSCPSPRVDARCSIGPHSASYSTISSATGPLGSFTDGPKSSPIPHWCVPPAALNLQLSLGPAVKSSSQWSSLRVSSSSHPGALEQLGGPGVFRGPPASLLREILGPAGPASIVQPARARLRLCHPGEAQRTTLQARWGRPGPPHPCPGRCAFAPYQRGCTVGPSLPREIGTRAPGFSSSPGPGCAALRLSSWGVPESGNPLRRLSSAPAASEVQYNRGWSRDQARFCR
ncbi:hypothetical protein NDU88_004654 [Pleurodeles waltl]|uniref:Uncharacterized protein n=1 Tax=Pleurodeles waltl TaxID=8319 RepID=A0AAV7SJI5_PLEWA|nr:hypothetical protein NDU88_004654 [Pleurodeles waltl]